MCVATYIMLIRMIFKNKMCIHSYLGKYTDVHIGTCSMASNFVIQNFRKTFASRIF